MLFPVQVHESEFSECACIRGINVGGPTGIGKSGVERLVAIRVPE